jgi:S-layer protein
LTLTAASTALTVVDASGLAATGITPGFAWTPGALAAANAVTGSTTGTNTIDLTASIAAATTYTGGTGDDVIIVTNSKNNIFTLGAGANSVNTSTSAGTGNNTVSAGAGTDTVKFLSGNNTVSLGDGTNTFTATSGNNAYTGGAGADTVNLTTGRNTIATGTGNDVVTVGSHAGAFGVNGIDVGGGTDTVSVLGNSASALTFTSITGLGIGDTLQIGNSLMGTVTFGTAAIPNLGSLAVFTDYVNAASFSAVVSDSNIAWFQFGGDTYIVVDNSVAASFQEGADSVVKLTGLVTVNGFAAVGDVDNLTSGSQAGVGFTFA